MDGFNTKGTILGIKLAGAQITEYADTMGNRITGTPRLLGPATVEFLGSNCHLHFAPGARIQGSISFRRDNSTVAIGHDSWFRGQMSLGLECRVTFGDNIYCGRNLYVTTAEGADIILGDDLLISDNCYIRADDSHPIYDGPTGARINPARPVAIGDHVWIGQEVFLMPGAVVGSGAIVGARSMVTRTNPVPPNALAIGSPAKVQRDGVQWVRKHLQNSHDIEEQIMPIEPPSSSSDHDERAAADMHSTDYDPFTPTFYDAPETLEYPEAVR